MRRVPAGSIAIVTLLTFAAPATARTEWICGLSADLLRLVCIADADDEPVPRAVEATQHSVNGTSFPLDPRRLYIVDLWAPPTEAGAVRLLARATLCYRMPECSVSVQLPRELADAEGDPGR